MSNSNSDRNLLIGVLGLQYGLVSAQQLVAAITAWRGDKSRALEDVLLELKILTEDGCAKLRSIVEMYLQMHGGDVGKSLAALSSVVEVEHDLQEVDDSDLEQSLQHFSQRPDDVDLYRTQSFDNSTASAVGSASSGGVRFRILRPHARGGLGEVSVALDSELNREVALKEIQRKHADQDASRSRFMLEAQITGGLEHPGIVPVYGM